MKKDKNASDFDVSAEAVSTTARKSHLPSLSKLLGGWQLRVALSTVLIGLFAGSVNWSRVADALVAADRVLLAAAFLVLASAQLISAERWRNTALASKVDLPRSFFLRATFAAGFAGQFLPAAIGVDAVRLGFLWRCRIALRPAVQSIAVDRIVGVSAILILMLTGLPFAIHRLPPTAILPTVLLAILLICGFVLLVFLDELPLPRWTQPPWAGRFLCLLSDARATIRTRRAAMALGYAIGLHSLCIFAVLLLARSFGYSLHYRDLLTVVSFTIFSALLPISFNGWGVREGAMVIGLSLLSVAPESAFMISFLYGVGSALATLPGSLTWHYLKSHAADSRVA